MAMPMSGKLFNSPMSCVLPITRVSQGRRSLHGRRARPIAEDRHVADEIVAAHGGDLDFGVAGLDEDVGRALDDHEGPVAEFSLAAQGLATVELQPLGRERQKLQLRRVDRGEDRHLAQDLDIFLQ